MAEKRRDNKGRVLRSGESQRSDGKYEYKYADSNGERHSVYSWKLVATDKVPEGKQGGTSLRDMESLELRPIEQAKISCAKKLFNEMSTSKVKYHDVDSYQSLLNIINSL